MKKGKVNKFTVNAPHKISNEVLDNHFAMDYSFVKPHSVRSPLSAREHAWKTHPEYGVTPGSKEYNFLNATPSHFGHTAAQRKSNLRVSGKKGAHQIGMRSKAKAR